MSWSTTTSERCQNQDMLFVGLFGFECNKVTELSIECASAASQAVCLVSLMEEFEALIQTFRIWSCGGLSSFYHCVFLNFISFRKFVSGESDRSLAQNAVNICQRPLLVLCLSVEGSLLQRATKDWGLAEFYHPLNEYNVRHGFLPPRQFRICFTRLRVTWWSSGHWQGGISTLQRSWAVGWCDFDAISRRCCKKPGYMQRTGMITQKVKKHPTSHSWGFANSK